MSHDSHTSPTLCHCFAETVSGNSTLNVTTESPPTAVGGVPPDAAGGRFSALDVIGIPGHPLAEAVPTAPPMIQVEEINDLRELSGLRLLWNSLLPQTPNATFFQSLDWLEVYWKHFGGRDRLRVLVVSSDARPVGILPLVVRNESTRLGRMRVLTYPLHDWGTFYGPIGPNPTATLTAGLRHVRQTRRDWDLLDLRWVDLDGCDRGRTEAALRRTGFEPRKQAWDQAATIELPDTWDEYWQSRTTKWRRNVRRLIRRMAERGKICFLRYRPCGATEGDVDPRWDLYDTCVELAQLSWQGSSINGTTLSHPQVRDYLRDTHAAAARSGSVDLNVLRLGGRPIAFVYCYRYDGRVYGLRRGFDPEFSTFGPGEVLMRMMLQDGIARGDTFYDLGVGSLDAKRRWQTSLATSYRFTHFPACGARAQLMRMRRWMQNRVQGEASIACARSA